LPGDDKSCRIRHANLKYVAGKQLRTKSLPMSELRRSDILPEPDLPQAAALMAEGRRLAKDYAVGPCPFLQEYSVRSEADYKRRRMAERAIMLHAQIGYRSPQKSRRAYAEIHERVVRAGYRVDRYGICLDWSMGYPASRRENMPRGTGLILEGPEEFAALTAMAPAAPHFGDFVIGTPASVENTAAALVAGSTSIGNLGQYFTFRMPRWPDDVGTTAETVKALALCAAQPVEVLIHSNLDDGFASLFTDMACGIGAVLIERTIVEDLIGGRMAHCYGHTYSDPLTRLAFQRALARVTSSPGSMVYGNTTIFVEGEIENYANLASYLLVDIVAQNLQPTGHAINPVPVSEALHIPEIEDVVDAQLFANRLVHRAGGFEPLFSLDEADRIAERLVEGGQQFAANVLHGLAEAGIDTTDPFELLLAIRRIGAKRLEELFGPGKPDNRQLRGRVPTIRATTVTELEWRSEEIAAHLSRDERQQLRSAGLVACVACTDVHEYGKLLLEAVLRKVGVGVVDAGVSVDPEAVARRALEAGAGVIAISTYNGVALDYLRSLRTEMTRNQLDLPVFVGGKLNRVPESDPSSLSVDVSGELRQLGGSPCHSIEEMLRALVEITGRGDTGTRRR
jgi:methylmalonyl-CoA mutase cobalamin-binding subunit